VDTLEQAIVRQMERDSDYRAEQLRRDFDYLEEQHRQHMQHMRVGEQLQNMGRTIEFYLRSILSLQDNIRALGNRITAVEGAQEQLLEQVRVMQATMDEITAEQVRDQEMHCAAMYREFCDELRNLRAERRNETDEDVKAELMEKMRRIEAAAQKMEVSGYIR
jgi:vacuolar-type H+-ATPase subunit I/STV1